MDSFERVSKALRREQPDRVPILTYMSGASANASEQLRSFVCANSDVFQTVGLFTGFQCTGLQPAVTERALEDGWVEITYGAGDGLLFTEIYKRGEKGAYIGYKKHILSEIADVGLMAKLPYIKPAENDQLSAWISEANAAARDHRASGAFTRFSINGPLFYLAGYAMPEDFAFWTVDHKKTLLSFMDTVLERELEYLDYALQRIEFDPIFIICGADWALPPLMPPRSFDEFVMKYDKPLVDMVHRYSHLIFYHCHGKVRNFIQGFIEMGADGLHPLEPIGTTGDCDLAEVKREFGRDICLIGNIQYDDLVRLSPDEMEETVRRAVSSAKDGGGFILAPSCTPYHTPLPAAVEENIIRYIEAGLKLGGY